MLHLRVKQTYSTSCGDFLSELIDDVELLPNLFINDLPAAEEFFVKYLLLILLHYSLFDIFILSLICS